jgi:inorganic phosphate transporter, PiT family
MTLALLFFAVCFLGYANGANDNFKGVASLYGSGAASYRVALTWATVTTLAGSLCALYLAQSLIVKFSGKGLIPDTLIQSVPFMLAVAAGAGITVILATRFGFPVSTTHALIGAMLGSGLLATSGGVNIIALKNNFLLPLLLSPMVAVMLATLIYFLFKQAQQRLKVSQSLCLCIDDEIVTTSHAGALVMAREINTVITLAEEADCDSRYAGKVLGVEVKSAVDKMHFFSAGSVCFARGLNDTPKIAALLLLFPAMTVAWAIVLVAVVIALGGLINARRVAETMSHKITELSHGQGLAANLSTALLVVFASKFGMPVSTTHVSVGSLFGIGLSNGRVQQRMIGTILLSWLLTLPCAALCSAVAYYAVNKF